MLVTYYYKLGLNATFIDPVRGVVATVTTTYFQVKGEVPSEAETRKMIIDGALASYQVKLRQLGRVKTL